MIFLGPEDTQDSWSVSQKSHEAAIRVEGAPRGVGRAPTLVVASGLFWPISGTLWASSGPKMISVKFQVNWTPFGFPFL